MARAATTNKEPEQPEHAGHATPDEELHLILEAIAEEKVPDRLLILAADLQELLQLRVRRKLH